MDATDGIVFACVIVAALYVIRSERGSEVVRAKSSVDGRWYVVRNLPDYQQAADLIGRINAVLEGTIRALARERGDKDAHVVRLRERYRPGSLSEATSESRYYTSYSVNKGEKIVLCLRSKDDHRLVDANTLAYVALHELGHVMTEEVGHTPAFWRNFRELIRVAVGAGLYEPVDYRTHPEEYCGIVIQSSVIDQGSQTGGFTIRKN